MIGLVGMIGLVVVLRVRVDRVAHHGDLHLGREPACLSGRVLLWWVDLLGDMHFACLRRAVAAFDVMATLALKVTLLILLAAVHGTNYGQLLLRCLLLIPALQLLILLSDMNLWRALL